MNNVQFLLHGKPYFLFPDALKRWYFQKNRSGIWSFLYYRERQYFFFQKIWSYILGGKWMLIFLKNDTRKNGIFFKLSEKMVFSNKATLGHGLSLSSRKVVFFLSKTFFFSLGRKWEVTFLKKYMEIWYFLCTLRVLQTWRHAPLSKRKSKMVFSRRYTPKGDWRSRLTT